MSKVSLYTAATSMSGADMIYVVQGGVSKNATLDVARVGIFATPPVAMTTAIDFDALENDVTLTATSYTWTVTGTPTTGKATSIRVIGHTAASTITLPAGTWRSAGLNSAITTFVVPANWQGRIGVAKTAAGYDIIGEPQPLLQKAIESTFATGGNDTQTVALHLPSGFAGTITNFITQCSSGTATYVLNINGTPVTGASNSVSTTKVNNTATAANVVVAGDKITITRSADATCINADFAILVTPSSL